MGINSHRFAEITKYTLLQVAIYLGNFLPRKVAYSGSWIFGSLAYYVRFSKRADVENNMRHVLGEHSSQKEVSRNAREVFRSVTSYYVDLIRLPKIHSEIGSVVKMHGFERLKGLLDSGHGVVITTAHFGSPEMAVQAGVILGLNILVLDEPLPGPIAKTMLSLRSTFGAKYIDVGYNGLSKAIRHLKSSGCLAVACDRDIQGTGIKLPFFGSPTNIPLGAVELATKTNSVLMPGYCKRVGSGFEVFFEEPLELIDTGKAKEDAITNTLRLIKRMEEWITSDPGQWMVLERIWK